MTAMTSDLMDGLVQWLRAQLAEYERIARAATPGPWEQDSKRVGFLASTEYWDVVDCSGTPAARENVEHIAAHDPVRVLRETHAKRKLVNLHGPVRNVQPDGITNLDCSTCGGEDRLSPSWPCLTIRLIALAYADRPGYREEWQP